MQIRRFFLMLLALLLPASAWAYVDPGSGMLMLQAVLAAVGAAIVFIRKPVEILKRLLRRLRKKQ